MAVKIIFRSQELSSPPQFRLLSPYDPVLEMSLDRHLQLSQHSETFAGEIAGRVVKALVEEGKAALAASGLSPHVERS